MNINPQLSARLARFCRLRLLRFPQGRGSRPYPSASATPGNIVKPPGTLVNICQSILRCRANIN